MPASVDGIFTQINCRTANTSILPVCSMAKLGKAAGSATEAASSTSHWVSTFSALPVANCVTGAFYYIQDQCLYAYSNGSSWQDDYSISCNEHRLYTWGLSTDGQLGDNQCVTNRSVPGLTTGEGKNWDKVGAVAGHFTLATKKDGTLWAWGRNTCGQLGDSTTIARLSPVQITGFSNWSQLTGGNCHSAGINMAGFLLAWGYNGCGQLGTNNLINRSSPVREVTNTCTWKNVSAGCDHTLAIKTDGTLWTWGSNTCGVLGTGNTTNRSSPGTTAGCGTNWYSVSSEWQHNLGIKTDGTLWSWGLNSTGQLGDETTINRCSPVTTAGGGTSWCYASAGKDFSVAVKSDGTVWTWGLNTCGQLGDGTIINKSSPVTVAGGGTTWFEVASGCAHVLAKKTDGSLWSWGQNNFGQLGTNDTINRSSPVTVVSANTNWTGVAAGQQHSVGVQSTVIIL